MTEAFLVWAAVLIGSILVIVMSHSDDKDTQTLSIIIAIGIVLLSVYGVDLHEQYHRRLP